jgi:hypothetical protein
LRPNREARLPAGGRENCVAICGDIDLLPQNAVAVTAAQKRQTIVRADVSDTCIW